MAKSGTLTPAMPRNLPPIHITDPQDAQLAEYRAVAGQAVLGLIFGLLSPVALIDPMLWVVPLLGVFFSVWALRRINKYAPAMIGRKAALVALALSLLFAAAAPADWLIYRKMVGSCASNSGMVHARVTNRGGTP